MSENIDGEYKIENTWKVLFDNYDFDIDDLYSNSIVYPNRNKLFELFKEPSDEIGICILNQEPFCDIEGQNGFAFSVDNEILIPISTNIIFQEIKNEFPERNYNFIHGNLKKWSERGIFLLNCSLSVEKNNPNSHIEIWEEFINDVIHKISEDNLYCIFVLLGDNVKSKRKYITNNKNTIIECKHPTSNKGFIGSNVFKQIEYIYGDSINWNN